MTLSHLFFKRDHCAMASSDTQPSIALTLAVPPHEPVTPAKSTSFAIAPCPVCGAEPRHWWVCAPAVWPVPAEDFCHYCGSATPSARPWVRRLVRARLGRVRCRQQIEGCKPEDCSAHDLGRRLGQLGQKNAGTWRCRPNRCVRRSSCRKTSHTSQILKLRIA